MGFIFIKSGNILSLFFIISISYDQIHNNNVFSDILREWNMNCYWHENINLGT